MPGRRLPARAADQFASGTAGPALAPVRAVACPVVRCMAGAATRRVGAHGFVMRAFASCTAIRLTSARLRRWSSSPSRSSCSSSPLPPRRMPPWMRRTARTSPARSTTRSGPSPRPSTPQKRLLLPRPALPRCESRPTRLRAGAGHDRVSPFSRTCWCAQPVAGAGAAPQRGSVMRRRLLALCVMTCALLANAS